MRFERDQCVAATHDPFFDSVVIQIDRSDQRSTADRSRGPKPSVPERRENLNRALTREEVGSGMLGASRELKVPWPRDGMPRLSAERFVALIRQQRDLRVPAILR